MLSSSSVQEAQDLALDRPRRDARVARAVPALLRRLPHLARAAEDRRPLDDEIVRAMIDERSRGRASRARADAGSSGRARHGAEPRRLLPEPRSGQPLLPRRRPAIVQRAMDRFAALTGRAHPLFEYRRRARRRARHRDHGVGRRDRARPPSTRSAAPARVGVLTVQALSPVQRRRTSSRRCRRPSARSPCSIAPRNPARSASRSTRTSSRRCVEASPRRRADTSARHRRPLRARVQGIHAGDGEGGLRRARDGRRRSATSPSASSTT